VQISSEDAAAADPGDEPNPEDFYTTLGVPIDFTATELKQAFRTMSRANHPDKGGSTARFQAIATAHDVLSDPHRRRAYDEGADLPRHPTHPDGDEWTLKSEVEKRYFPEARGFWLFGDPHENRREIERREENDRLAAEARQAAMDERRRAMEERTLEAAVEAAANRPNDEL
jgi:DnaJ-class molecular chaperone